MILALLIIILYIICAGITAKIFMIRKRDGKTFRECYYGDEEAGVFSAGLFWPVLTLLAVGSWIGEKLMDRGE